MEEERPPRVSSDYDEDTRRPVDASYSDPIGAMPARPRTAAVRRADSEDEWGDEELDEMLPE